MECTDYIRTRQCQVFFTFRWNPGQLAQSRPEHAPDAPNVPRFPRTTARLRRHYRHLRGRGAAEIPADAGTGRLLGRVVRAMQGAGADPRETGGRIQRRLRTGHGRYRGRAAARPCMPDPLAPVRLPHHLRADLLRLPWLTAR